MYGNSLLPEPPRITNDHWETCRKTGDYCSILFEWYKFVATLCSYVASIDRRSPTIRSIAPVQYAIAVGLLNRCSRLMLSGVVLSHKGLHGETTAILDRCIFESCIKVGWLCDADNRDGFVRYLADGLKADIELKSQILKIVEARSGTLLEIERRMLSSIERGVAASGLNESEISECKRMPDLASMMDRLGQDRLIYVVGQRLGSHHVHGTWTSLRMHYLREDEGESLVLRDHDCITHEEQYIFVMSAALFALRRFVRYMIEEEEVTSAFEGLFEAVVLEIDKVNGELAKGDYDVHQAESQHGG